MNRAYRPRVYLTAILATGCALALAAGCSKPEVLQVHFAEGFERTYETVDSKEMEMVMAFANDSVRQSERTDSTLRYTVVDSGAGEHPANLLVTFEEMDASFRMSVMGETVSFDGADDGGPIARLSDSVAGESYEVNVEPSGNIVGIEGVAELFEKVLESQDYGALTRSEISAYLTETWTTDSARLSIQKTVFAHLPMTHVEPGSSWSVTYTASDPIPMSVEDTYRVLNVHEDRITIDVTSVVSPHPTESSIDFGGGFSINFVARGEGEGFIEIDRATGWINEASSTLSIRGDAEVQGLPVPLPGGMNKLPMTARVQFESRALWPTRTGIPHGGYAVPRLRFHCAGS